jgi:hypothetical protein
LVWSCAWPHSHYHSIDKEYNTTFKLAYFPCFDSDRQSSLCIKWSSINYLSKCTEAIFLVVCDTPMNELWATWTSLWIYLYGSRSLTARSQEGRTRLKIRPQEKLFLIKTLYSCGTVYQPNGRLLSESKYHIATNLGLLGQVIMSPLAWCQLS